MNTTSFIIYGLFDPRDGEIRYVGKSETGTDRFKGHLRPSALKPKTRRTSWIKSVLAAGERPIGSVIQSLSTRQGLAEAEVYWIAFFKAEGCRLTNGTAGGEGVVDPSPEVRAKLSAASRGRRCTPEQLERLSIAHRGQIISESTRRAVSLAMRGKPKSLETRAKMKAAQAKRVQWRRWLVDANGVRHHGQKAAATAFGVSEWTVKNYLKGNHSRLLAPTGLRVAP